MLAKGIALCKKRIIAESTTGIHAQNAVQANFFPLEGWRHGEVWRAYGVIDVACAPRLGPCRPAWVGQPAPPWTLWIAGHEDEKARTERAWDVAGGRGFEPRLTESESAVLPLDDPPRILLVEGLGYRALAPAHNLPPPAVISISACCTEDACGPCAGPPSCVPPHGRRG